MAMNRLPATIRRVRRPPGGQGSKMPKPRRADHDNRLYDQSHLEQLLAAGDHERARKGMLLRGMPARVADRHIKRVTATGAPAPKKPRLHDDADET
jgi:hypothetical protein